MTYTKGPWQVRTGSFGVGRFVADKYGNPICRIAANTTPKTMERERKGEHEANSHLIAAAPDLLECLQWYIDNDEVSEGMEGNEFWEDGLNRARAAIAKATGETS